VTTTTGFGPALRVWRTRSRVSQLELALRAGTTQRHVSFMESGRSVPGRGMVVRVAESLGLPLRERNSLLLAAGYAPSYPETRLDDPALRPVLDGLRDLLDGHRPYPAIVVDRYGDLVAANDATGVLFEDVAPDLLAPPVNVLRLALHPRGMAPRIVNLDDWNVPARSTPAPPIPASRPCPPNSGTTCPPPRHRQRTTSVSPCRCGCARQPVNCGC
jgi:transcriptional regulator with XRE-family HTH domain